VKLTPILVILVVVGVAAAAIVFLNSQTAPPEVSDFPEVDKPVPAPGGIDRPQRPAPVQDILPDPIIPQAPQPEPEPDPALEPVPEPEREPVEGPAMRPELQPPPPEPEERVRAADVTIHFIDVGQGDATLIDTTEKDVLIDAGTRSNGQLVFDYLIANSITRLDFVIGTHPDADHIGGLITLMNEFDLRGFEIPVVLDSGDSKDTQTYLDYLALAQFRNLTIVERGMVIQLDPSTRMTILNPIQPLEFSDANDNSIVILLEVGDVSIWLGADCERACEESIREAGLQSDVDVLRVGHHGSRTSTSSEFLSETIPEVAVISSGDGNRYGHPHSEVLERLEGLATILRTDLHGSIIMETDGIIYFLSQEVTFVGDGPEPEPIPDPAPEPIPEPEPEPMAEPEDTGLNVVINEVEANPSGADAGNEWVELFNPLSEDVDIGGWMIVTTHGRIESFTFTSGTTIPGGGHLVVQFPSQFIDNGDEVLILRNDLGNEVDRTPILDDSQNDNRTWQRKVDGFDNDQDDDWVFLVESRREE